MEILEYIVANIEALLSFLFVFVTLLYVFIFFLFYYKKAKKRVKLISFINGLIVFNNQNHIKSPNDVINLFMSYYGLQIITGREHSHFVLTLRETIKILMINFHKYKKRIDENATRTLPDIIDILNQTVDQFIETNEFYDMPEPIGILLRDLQQNIKSTNVEAGLSRIGDIKRTLKDLYDNNEFLKKVSEKQSLHTKIGIGLTIFFGLLSFRAFLSNY